MKLQEVTLRKVRLPLIRPYVLSYRTFNEFEPIIVEVRDSDGRVGWGEGHISPGSSSETRDGGWAFCQEHADAIVGKQIEDAKAIVAADLSNSKVAATALLTAIEMLEGHPLLNIANEVRLPLLTPFNSSTPNDIELEVERRLEEGFRTVKIKWAKTPALTLRAFRQSSGQSIAAQRCVSTPIAPTRRPMPAALPPPSTRPASNCSSSHAALRIGTPMPMSRRCPPCPSC
jgi:L-Ala-D/L-Glu epimerase